jgi:SAM-dependent methyltransferase
MRTPVQKRRVIEFLAGTEARPGSSRVAPVTMQDRLRWDERYASQGPPPVGAIGPPDIFAPHADAFPTTGQALDLACGPGLCAVWLAQRGLRVSAIDISPVAVGQARDLARRSGVEDRCRFDEFDLDEGLPGRPLSEGRADVVVCHKFWDRRLSQAIIGRLAPGGLLAIAVHSEVDAAPGPFRAKPGELTAAFADLEPEDKGEGQGYAWLLARAGVR